MLGSRTTIHSNYDMTFRPENTRKKAREGKNECAYVCVVTNRTETAQHTHTHTYTQTQTHGLTCFDTMSMSAYVGAIVEQEKKSGSASRRFRIFLGLA